MKLKYVFFFETIYYINKTLHPKIKKAQIMKTIAFIMVTNISTRKMRDLLSNVSYFKGFLIIV